MQGEPRFLRSVFQKVRSILENYPLLAVFSSSEYERRERNLTGVLLKRQAHRLPSESDEDFYGRIHAMLVSQRGLPRVAHVVRWLRKGRVNLVPPREQIWEYAQTRFKEHGPQDKEFLNAIKLLGLVDEINQRPMDTEDLDALETLRKYDALHK